MLRRAKALFVFVLCAGSTSCVGGEVGATCQGAYCPTAPVDSAPAGLLNPNTSAQAANAAVTSSIAASVPAAQPSGPVGTLPAAMAIPADPTDSNKWNLVWSDEFDAASLDTSKWTQEVSCNGGGNNEWECYTGSPNNTFLQNGILHIRALQTSYKQGGYTSGRMNSMNKGDWAYGRFAARMQLPCGQGMWPAFWMMPTTSAYGAWPASGELDIMELNGASPSIIYGTAHFGVAAPTQLGGKVVSPDDFCQAYHTYVLERDAHQVRWYIDSFQYFAMNDTDGNWGLAHWPFDQPFYFIFNLAVGGNFVGNPDPNITSADLLVDWVRTYAAK